MQLVPTGMLTLRQVIARLTDIQVPGLNRKVTNEESELRGLEKAHAPVSRAPPPIRPIDDNRSGPIERSRRRSAPLGPEPEQPNRKKRIGRATRSQ